MSILGFCMTKNDGDILNSTIRHFLAEGLDHIYIFDNLSSDNTGDILERFVWEFPERVSVFEDNEYGYYQERKMNNWINAYAETGDWIVPFDSDEIWYSPTGETIATVLNKPSDIFVVECHVWDMIPLIYTNSEYPPRDIVWRNPAAEKYPVVCYRYYPGTRLHAGNHGVDHQGKMLKGGLFVAHFQYRSFDQYERKLRNGKAVYDATDLDPGLGQHWREGGEKTREELWDQWVEYCEKTPTVVQPVPLRYAQGVNVGP